MNNHEILLQVLRKLKRDLDEGVYPKSGICKYIIYHVAFHRECLEIANIFKSIAKAWPKNSNKTGFPVPGTGDECDPSRAYQNLHKWDGEYGALRRELLDFCISTLEERLAL